MDENASARLTTYKYRGKDNSEMRRRRNDVTIELRKSKRDDQVLKRRNLTELDKSPLKENNSQQQVIQILPLPTVLQNLQQGNDNLTFVSVQSVRKMLSKEKSPPIDPVIKAGMIPYLVKFLERFDFPLLQFESAWALTNIASGNSDQTRAVVEGGALPLFVKLLLSQHPNVCEQAVWALGNIAGDGPVMRNAVISCNALGPLLTLTADKNVSDQFLRNVTWTLSNLCRNKDPPPDIEAVKQVLPTLVGLLFHTDKEVLADTCWAMSYLTDGVNDRIQLVIDSGAVAKLVTLLGYPEVNVVTPALRAVGNIVTGRDDQTQAIIEANALYYFRNLLTHKRATVVKEAAWAISNITAGTKPQIQNVIEAGLVPLVIDILRRGHDFKAKKEAIWVITNYASGANPDQINYMLHCDVIPVMCEQLKIKDSKALMILLEGFHNIFSNSSSADGALDFALNSFQENEGTNMLEELQYHPKTEVYEVCHKIIAAFFPDNEGEEDINLQPDATSHGFKFATPLTAPVAGFTFAE